ncbi:MarR family transcriptional regulator [Acetobacter vaccinii]|uniref:Helix-turn-helix domain-containing protein n=1 Tax=Acetobacter vaccinii TaxID=2592655 RepID=A0A5C1YS69_9PROT|nr:helix-turn-helix domain-containing protein [Acetobacter vaccinii]QEO18921.1 helix-turn-helix domain-containing protein [Acetobacter vaccinii]
MPPRKPSAARTLSRPPLYARMSAPARAMARHTVRAHIRECLQRGPHAVLELRRDIPLPMLGAFHVILEEMVHAGEIASIGHGVYVQVPWMPQTIPVQASPLADLVLATLADTTKPGHTVAQLAQALALTHAQVHAALASLETMGLIEPGRGAGQYRPASPRMASHIRRGARERVFADVASHEAPGLCDEVGDE